MIQLPEAVTVLSKEGNRAVFEIAPLMPGYGPTLANPLRRILLSSLEGAAITSVKIRGVDHEFSTIPGVAEDIIQLIINVKKIRLRSFSQEPIVLILRAKGEEMITARDIQTTPDVEIINEDQPIATLTNKKAEFEMELTVEKGVGYVPVEQRQKGKLPIGMISIDAIFSPVKLVNFRVDDIRVGQQIDFNKVTMEIETDGTIAPEAALKRASEILVEHFNIIAQVSIAASEPSLRKSKSKKVI